MRVIIPFLLGLLPFGALANLPSDTLTPPEGYIIYSPDCSTGGLGPLFGFTIPSNPGATFRWEGPNGFSTTQAGFTPADTGLYILTVTVDNCPSVPDSIRVRYFEPPMVEASAPSNFYCPEEDTLQLSAAANSELVFWRRLLPNGASSYIGSGETLQVPASVLGLNTERIIVTANGAYGCEGVDTLVLTRLASLSAGQTLLGCPGDTAIISAAGQGSFLWNTGDTTGSIQVVVDTASTFTVQFDDGAGCAVSDSLSITIEQGAYVSLSTRHPVLCQGDTALLKAAGGIGYLWEDGSAKDSLLVAPMANDTFRVTITTAEGCIVKKALPIKAVALPQATLSILPTAICEGDSVRVTLAGADTTYYQVRETPTKDTLFTFTLDNQGCMATFADSLTVHPRPALAIEGPGQVCEGEQATLAAVVNQDSLQFLWNTGSSDSLILETPQAPSSTYGVTVTNPGTGCRAADSVQVLATPLPLAPVVQCSTVYEEAFFEWAYDPALEYSMQILNGSGGTLLNDSTLWLGNLLPGQEAVVELTATDSLGCASTTRHSCTTPECRLALSLDTLSDICLYPDTELFGLSATLSGSLIPGTGQWEGTGGLLGPQGPFDPFIAGIGQHGLSYTYEEGPCQIDGSFDFAIYQPLLESMVECETTSNQALFTWQPLPQDSLYEVEVLTGQEGRFTGATSFVVDSLISEEEVSVAISAYGEGPCGIVEVEKTCRAAYCERPGRGISTIICAEDSTRLAASPIAADVFSWEPKEGLSCTDCPFPMASPDSTTTYTRTAIDSQGCIHTSTLTLGVADWPESLVPDTLYACGGRPFSFCLPGEKYDWSRPGVTDGLGPCLSFQSPEPGINGHYTLTARLSDSCILSREVFLTYTQPEDCELALRPGQNTNSLLSAVYPNPARAQAWVSTGTATAELIEIFDQNGQTVLRIRPEGTVTRLSLPGIKAGMYFIRARYKGGAEVIRLAIY